MKENLAWNSRARRIVVSAVGNEYAEGPTCTHAIATPLFSKAILEIGSTAPQIVGNLASPSALTFETQHHCVRRLRLFKLLFEVRGKILGRAQLAHWKGPTTFKNWHLGGGGWKASSSVDAQSALLPVLQDLRNFAWSCSKAFQERSASVHRWSLERCEWSSSSLFTSFLLNTTREEPLDHSVAARQRHPPFKSPFRPTPS